LRRPISGGAATGSHARVSGCASHLLKQIALDFGGVTSRWRQRPLLGGLGGIPPLYPHLNLEKGGRGTPNEGSRRRIEELIAIEIIRCKSQTGARPLVAPNPRLGGSSPPTPPRGLSRLSLSQLCRDTRYRCVNENFR